MRWRRPAGPNPNLQRADGGEGRRRSLVSRQRVRQGGPRGVARRRARGRESRAGRSTAASRGGTPSGRGVTHYKRAAVARDSMAARRPRRPRRMCAPTAETTRRAASAARRRSARAHDAAAASRRAEERAAAAEQSTALERAKECRRRDRAASECTRERVRPRGSAPRKSGRERSGTGKSEAAKRVQAKECTAKEARAASGGPSAHRAQAPLAAAEAEARRHLEAIRLGSTSAPCA